MNTGMVAVAGPDARLHGRRHAGFTLVEMLVVLTLLGVLASAARPMLEVTARRTRETELRHSLRQLRQALDDYKRASDQGHIAKAPGDSGYPPNLEALVQGVVDERSPERAGRLYFLRRLPRDPFAPVELDAALTWALRSHDSPPHSPAPGRDVFDVASRSPLRALDGTALSQW